MLLFWGILQLWAELFILIKIKFFKDLFKEELFYYPVLSVAFGIGIIIVNRFSEIIETLAFIQQALMKFLLPVVILLLLSFLIILPLKGFNLIWDTHFGSSILLWLQAITLFFVNAVYQDEEKENKPYHKWLHTTIYIGVATLPLYSILAFYGLYTRIDQYGWTLSR